MFTTSTNTPPTPCSEDGAPAPLVNTRSMHSGFGLADPPDAQQLQRGTDCAMRDWFALAMYAGSLLHVWCVMCGCDV